MELYDWEGTTRQWAARRRNLPPTFGDQLVAFFRQAFDRTAFPDRSWFGVHQQVVSLVVGNIWLTSVNLDASDRGAWTLLSRPPGAVAGWSFHPTKSTLGSATPLVWGHAQDATDITAALAHEAFWQRFAEASRDVFTASSVSGDRDETQLKRGKVRLSDFWNSSTLTAEFVLSEADLPTAPTTTSAQVSPFAREKEFEEAVILPLIQKFGWHAQREYTFTIPVGVKRLPVRVDVLVSDEGGPITLIENKLQILNERDLEFAMGQARSYASALELPSFVVAAPQGVWVYAFERGKVACRRKFEPNHLQQTQGELRNLLLELR